jgi:hypothetical protein
MLVEEANRMNTAKGTKKSKPCKIVIRNVMYIKEETKSKQQ